MQILDDEFTLPDNFAEGDQLSGKSLQSLQTVSNWALFLSVTGLGISVLTWFAFISVSRSFGAIMEGVGGTNSILYALAPFYGTISMMVTVAIGIHVTILIFHTRFALRLRRSIRLYDQKMFEKAWKDMRSLMRIFGVLMAVGLVFLGMLAYFILSVQATLPLN